MISFTFTARSQAVEYVALLLAFIFLMVCVQSKDESTPGLRQLPQLYGIFERARTLSQHDPVS